MPKLSKSDIVGALKPGTPNPFDDFVSDLPTGTMMERAEVSADYEREVARIPIGQYVNFGRSSQGTTARIVAAVGMADYVIKATPDNPLGRLGDLLEIDPDTFRNVTNPKAAMASLVTQAGMKALDVALDRVCTKVPIAGAIIKIALFLYDIFALAFQQAKEEPPPPEVKALAYDRETDALMVNRRLQWLERQGAGSLTALFLPASQPERVNEKRAEYTTRGQLGVTARVVGPAIADGWMHVPGTSMVGDVWQYPTAYRVDERGDKQLMIGRGGPSTGYAGLHPSVSQLSQLFWGMVTRNGADAFRIDGDRIASTWAEYFRVLALWAADAQHHDGGAWAEQRWAAMRPLISWAVMGVTQPPAYKTRVTSFLEGFYPEPKSPAGNLPAPEEDCPGAATCVPAEFVDWTMPVFKGYPPPGFVATWGGFVRFVVKVDWRDRLPNYLRTLTCAYVPERAAALRMDSKLEDLHADMRALLLTRTAVRLVDAGLIPKDADGTWGYRNAVMRAQATANELKLPDPKPPAKRVAIALDNVQPVYPEGLTPVPAKPVGPAVPGETSGVGWGWKAAAAVVAFAMLRGLARG